IGNYDDVASAWPAPAGRVPRLLSLARSPRRWMETLDSPCSFWIRCALILNPVLREAADGCYFPLQVKRSCAKPGASLVDPWHRPEHLAKRSSPREWESS